MFERETGAPLFPIEERAVPQDVVAGETPSPTQPFSSLPPLVSHAPVKPDDAWGLTFWDRDACREKIAALKSEGIFTPPSLKGSIERPGYAGGSNWGSGAWDPERQLLIANVMDVPMVVTLIPRDKLGAEYDSGLYKDWEFARQTGTPYAMRRKLLDSPLGAPCIAPPWGKLVAVDLARGKIAWEKPLGTSRDKAPWPFWSIEGAPNMGGPLDHRRRPRLHRRDDRQLSARVRHRERHRIVESAPSRRRAGDADELRSRRTPVRRHRGGRSCETRHDARRLHDRVRAAEGGMNPVPHVEETS